MTRDRGRGRLGSLLSRVRASLGGSDFVIRYRPDRPVEVRGKVPASKVGAISSFLAHDLQPAGPVTIRGSWGPRRSLRLLIDGALDAGQRQCIRNVLIDLLV
jgi:hypothetical protein